MRTVHKYPIAPTASGWFEISLPQGAKIIMIDNQMGNFQLWAEVRVGRGAPVLETRRLFMAGTGQPIPDDLRHLTSFMMNNGAFVWHVYEAQP